MNKNTESLAPTRSRVPQFFHKVGWVLWAIGVFFLLVLYWYPIRFGGLRLLMVLTIIALWGGTLVLLWRWLPARILLALPPLAALAVLLSPVRKADVMLLQADYLRALKSYEGTVYVWGGENRRGIDCSGLVRRGLIDANRDLGWRTLNPSLLRQSAEMWWYDCSAKALKDQYRQQTRLVCRVRSLNQADYRQLHAGDIAVTDSGVHTLAYLGDATWIQADPGAWKVVVEKVPSKSAWFSQPMHIMRWRQLDSN